MSVVLVCVVYALTIITEMLTATTDGVLIIWEAAMLSTVHGRSHSTLATDI